MVFQRGRVDEAEGAAQAMAADEQFFIASTTKNRLAKISIKNSSRHLKGIAKAKMHIAHSSKVRARNLGLANRSDLRFHRTKGRIGDEVSKPLHLSATPSHQHLGNTDSVKQLGVTFRHVCLSGIQGFDRQITITKRHINHHAWPCLAVIPNPSCT